MDIVDFKYKERNPDETVKIIKEFFNSKGYKIYFTENQSEASTYSCHLCLYGGDIFIAYSNGKGVTKELAIASGYSELYERFCSRLYYLFNNTLCHFITEANFKKNGYFFANNEKLITYEEILSEKNIKDFFVNLIGNNKNRIESLLWEILCGNYGVGIPFKSPVNGNIKYYDPRVLVRLTGSTGFAAGNTEKEAFIQGFSECIERFTIRLAMYDEEATFYELNLDKIENKNLQNMINAIKKAGHDLHLYDLSLTYGTPVIMAVLVCKKSYSTRINFGCFPVFEVAAERAITEMYQNIIRFNSIEQNDLYQIPHKSMSPPGIFYYASHGLMETAYVPLYIAEKTKQVDTGNRDGFLDYKDNDNEKLFKYYQNFIQENDLDVSYNEMGMDDRIAVVYVYIANLQYYAEAYWEPDVYGNDEINGYKTIRTIINDYFDLNFYLTSSIEEFDYNIIKSTIRNICDNAQNFETLYKVFGIDWCHPYPLIDSWDIPNFLKDLRNLNQETVLAKKYRNTFFYPYLKKYATMYNYKKSDYSKDELRNIFNYLKIDYTEEDLNSDLNLDYLFSHIVLIPTYQAFRDKRYKDFINTFVK